MTCTVVPPITAPTDPEFHAGLLTGLARCEKAVGPRKLAAAMDLSTRQLSKVLNHGAMPGPKAQWDALVACGTALDDIAALYGKAIVDRADGVDAPGTVPLATLLHKVAQAESPTSDGGTAKTHRELLAMEVDIRTIHQLTAAWIEEINAIRAPSAGTT